MSGFTRDWLALREAADHEARADFSAALAPQECAAWTIVDLGCGTGSNYRFVSPRLAEPQSWSCVDNDPRLLAALMSDRNPGDSRVTSHCVDIAADVGATLAALLTAPGDCTMVTASALLDLVSASWIEHLVTACSTAGALAWFALSYDGRIELEPQLAEDSHLLGLINAHQRRDKGFGPALGGSAHAATCRAFVDQGYEIVEARSDWLLDTTHSALQGELLDGWLGAAREQAGDANALAAWIAQRREHLDAGVLGIRVGHRDLLAVPRSASAGV